MVTEMDSHQLASLLDRLGQFIIIPARVDVSTGMIVAESQDCSIVQDSLLHDDADVYGSFSDATSADAKALNQLEVLLCCYPNNWKIFIVY